MCVRVRVYVGVIVQRGVVKVKQLDMQGVHALVGLGVSCGTCL